MLKTVAQPDGWRLGPHVASGLTLRHYRSFEGCPSLATLRQRIAATKPELDRLGIHVMASQHDDGGVVLGDSHEYDADVDAFDKPLIDDLILRELREVIAIPDWTIASRWHGVYSKHPSRAWVEAEPIDNVKVVTGLEATVSGTGIKLFSTEFGADQRVSMVAKTGTLTGTGVGMGRDYTIFATMDGKVKYSKKAGDKNVVSVVA
jgi:ribosomal protein L27